ncbi:MAG: AAA family ATPase, partial [Nocardioidaceae bacterium]|nr:AAA family ATPase [Nocardioidaceae bacterium]
NANEIGSAFCADCGSPLTAGCPACGAATTPGQRFCRACGAALTGPPAAVIDGAPPVHAPAPRLPVAERRVCSVLFCDLVGFTPMSEAKDPEEVRELLSRYFEVARTIIGRYGGTVEKFIGDAVMAVWGTPSATEEDAERAVRAALELIDAVAQLGWEANAEGLSARAGVVTGSVAVTVGAAGEGMVAGDAVNTAARVQADAAAGTVLVDEGTMRRAEAAVGFAAAGEHRLKGKAAPMPLWRAERVLAGAGGSQRIDGLEAGFVGRGAELRLVKELFHTCVERRSPRLVSVTGAAGVGKSRLGWEFRKYIDGLLVTVWWHQGRCLSYGDGVAFWALGEMVRQRLGIAEEDSTQVAAEKLAAGLEERLTDPAERAYVGPRLAQLLGVEYGETGPVLGREELFAGWRLFFERLAATGPVVMVVEDLQHADVGLLDFLEHLLDWARDVPIFVLTLARPELETRRAGWGTGRRNNTTLTFDPLDDTAMHVLLDGLVPGMPAAAKTAIADRAEGIPLYAVETVRMLVDRDIVQPIDGAYRLVGDVGELAVPATLQSLLAARLDTLEPNARRLVADAAVLGGTFPGDALATISDQPEPEVRRLLAELVRREVLGVRADPLSPQRGHYAFLQTMFREVAYQTLSRRERKARHLTVAMHLRSTFADDGEEVAEVIANHLLDALAAVPDDPDSSTLRAEATTMLNRAGERAQRTGAPSTAATAYKTAADLQEREGDEAAKVAAAALRERAGYAASISGDSDAAIDSYRRAAETYRQHNRTRDAARADTGAGRELRRQGRHDQSRSLLEGALASLQADPDADTVDALAEIATLEAFSGHAAEADRLSAAALAHAQALDSSDVTLGELLTVRGIAHGVASRPVQSVASLREAVRRAESAQDGAGAGRAYLNLSDALLTSNPAEAAEAAAAAAAYCRRVGDRYNLPVAVSNQVQAFLLTGDWDKAEETYSSPDNPGTSPYSAVLLRALRGDHAGIDDLLPVSEQDWLDTEDHQEVATAATAFAAAAACAGDLSRTLTQAQLALGNADALGLRNEGIRWAWPLAGDAALALGELAEVDQLIQWLDEHPPGQLPAVLRAERLRIHAKHLALQGDPQAGDAFNDATRAFRELKSPYHLAVGLLDQAEHVANADLPAAHELAAEADAIARRLGAKPLRQRAEAVMLAGDDSVIQQPSRARQTAEPTPRSGPTTMSL